MTNGWVTKISTHQYGLNTVMNILWIVVDCLRNDAMSSNGYGRPTTTDIDERLERDFIDFTDTATQSGFTLNVISSLVTGTYPTTHGVIEWSDEFPEEMPTYAELVRDSDLAPVEAIPGMNFITDKWGLDVAFDTVHNLNDAKSVRDCNQAVAEEIRMKWEEVTSTRDRFNSFL